MRKKWLLALLCVVLLGGLQTGCGTESESGEQEWLAGGEVYVTGSPEEVHDATYRPEGDEQNISGTDNMSGTEPIYSAEGSAADQNEITPAPEPTSAPEVTLVMVGDILLHTPVAKSAETEDGGYDFSAVFANVKEEIQEADVALVNQEVIIGGSELGISGYPSFNAPYELGEALDEAGFDVILHATNHALDKGRRGLVNCLNFWQENYPEKAVLGIHDSEEDQGEIYVFEQDGIRIAILNYTYGTNGIPLPDDMPYGVDLLEQKRVEADLEKAEGLADFVIVCPHWGTEYVLEETAVQRKWAQLFADCGADLVLGTHPHVIEPIEWVDDTLVYYSLGNFVNWTSGTGEGVANRMVGGMASVSIGLDEGGEVVVTDYGIVPLVCHLEEGFGGVTVYPLAEYTEELAGKNEIVRQDGNFSLEYCRELCERVFAGLWQPE